MKTFLSTMVLAVALASAAHAQGRRGRDNAPKAGDAAPNFKAKMIGKREFVELKRAVEKSKKPVVLIFGSYT